ncbi:serine/threonine protein kinase [Hydrocoleum sp. CS-953]|uniref:trifunctional serine/threonine-protein kinase/ATP-binding protein/sensor histidine kinase n=1 Tax=Hydrocoleum sp. CS-953 TaxID=1671698 RepID=UPI000B9B25C3|nr:ATP-binding sensor histidine kinase [Hydrocoleum sp. CS-953]OZH51235.1 serine/threonine protein kinase [Hydrocoleum sp. CS-953]
MLNLPNYYLSENLYQGTRTMVYRGQRICDQKPVIIKVLRNPHPTFNELVQFRNQYIITRHLEHPAIVQPLALERYGNSYALVMPDNGAIALLNYWQNSEQTLSNFLHIAIQLSEALHYLNQQRIIHKDIKPGNIIINPETKQVQLIDFSISTLLPKEQQQLISPNVLEGTLAYISPEQTGRMNRGIDYRTDFYSLGVTFFELLTGKLPFTTTDPMELVHCHIAQIPKIGNRTEIPQVLSDIILKLMAKNAEERYQSALGLKHDLEQCLQQLQATGEITQFELGSKDLCDRFMIPEKLYGRETEVQKLLDGFALVAEGATLMMLVAGFSGIGKTAVVNEVHKPIVKQRGYFIKGKFDQFNRNIPFSAFVQAFRDLMGQLLGESDEELAVWKGKILDAVGENGQVIIDVVPEVERIIGTQPEVAELSGSAAQNRFNLLFSKFIRVFTTKEHPLVIFLDDLQWADSASLNLLKLLMDESEVGYLLVLGAYRDNEVFPAHPLMLTLDEINKQGANIETLTLTPLSETDINRLVAETLLCATSIAAPLSELVYQKTKGNPFFSTQFLKGLHEDECIKFEADAGYWQCDLTEVRQLALTDDVVEFMVGRLQKLPETNHNVLKLAACIGNQFDLAILAVVCEQTQDEVAGNLWRGLQEGFVIPNSDSYKFFQGEEQQEKSLENISVNYRFLHDRVQQAAYSLIPQGQKQATHLHIGRLLSKKLSPEEQESKIFTIVNHWNQAIELIAEPTERENLMQLNLTAGEKAKGSAAYTAALQYFQTALSLLDVESWQRNYELALKLHENYAEAAYLTGDFELMETIIEQVLNHQEDLLDVVKVHEIKIQAKMAQTEQLSALNIGIEFLGLLGIKVPESPGIEDLQVELAAISQAMEGKAIASLADLPLIDDKNQLAKVKILANLIAPCYQANPSLFPWVVCKLMQLLIQYGNTPQSALIYGDYGVVCILVLQDFTSAQEYGKLACKLDLSPQTGDGVSGTYVTGACISHYSTHVREAIPLLLKAYQAGLDTGNFQFGGFAISNRSQYLYLMGQNLFTLKGEMATTSHALATMKQENTLAWNQAFEQAVLNLLGESEVSWELIGTAYNETKSVPFQIAANDRTALHYVYLNKLILCYLFDQIPQALENAALAEFYLDGVVAFLDEYAWNFYDSLTQLAHYGDAETSVQKSILEKVETNQKKMQYWANYAPMNGQHKVDLVAAERHRVLGERFEAIELYDQAIAGAKENEYLQEEALANELAAKFYLDWGKQKVAAGYMQEAYYCYARWEAKAKINQLEAKYRQLLTPILQQQQVELNPLDSIEWVTQTLTSKTNTQTTSTGLSDTLDLAAILQAAQAISSIIELEPLLGNILQIILTNAGAQKAVLLITESERWQLRAIAQLTTDGTIETDTYSQPLTIQSPVPIRLIQYVKNTQSVVLINESKTEITGILEGYLLTYQPQSVFCVPLLHQGDLVAILYLEHPTTKGVFTTQRQTIIEFLCAQAAIALKNAQLYEQAQQALRDLQKAQLQIVQSEKMSALGSLLSGVAHEINNPLGFIAGNISMAQDNLTDLLEHLELYEENTAAEEIEDHAEDIDLEYLREDFPKILKSMNVGVEQMKNISTSLRIFSRKDQEHKTKFNIHDGIESTLVILKHRTKANDKRPAIETIKEYAELPEIKCFPGQLNQVFMNILANAIDAFEEANVGKTYAEIEKKPNQINISTANVDENEVKIEIEDNGSGMKPETKERIFEQGFTTKGVGKGTGLGMAIAHQIITEKHGGEITCDSTVGEGTIFRIILPIV